MRRPLDDDDDDDNFGEEGVSTQVSNAQLNEVCTAPRISSGQLHGISSGGGPVEQRRVPRLWSSAHVRGRRAVSPSDHWRGVVRSRPRLSSLSSGSWASKHVVLPSVVHVVFLFASVSSVLQLTQMAKLTTQSRSSAFDSETTAELN